MSRIVGFQHYRDTHYRGRRERRDRPVAEPPARVGVRAPLSAGQRAHRFRMLGHLRAIARLR